MSWRGYGLMSTLMQWLSSVYNQWLYTWDGTLPDTAVILRDQAEGHLLHQINYIAAWLSVPRRSLNHSTGDVDQMLGSANDYLSLVNCVSSERRVGLWWIMGWWALDWANPDRGGQPGNKGGVSHSWKEGLGKVDVQGTKKVSQVPVDYHQAPHGWLQPSSYMQHMWPWASHSQVCWDWQPTLLVYQL